MIAPPFISRARMMIGSSDDPEIAYARSTWYWRVLIVVAFIALVGVWFAEVLEYRLVTDMLNTRYDRTYETSKPPINREELDALLAVFETRAANTARLSSQSMSSVSDPSR